MTHLHEGSEADESREKIQELHGQLQTMRSRECNLQQQKKKHKSSTVSGQHFTDNRFPV